MWNALLLDRPLLGGYDGEGHLGKVSPKMARTNLKTGCQPAQEAHMPIVSLIIAPAESLACDYDDCGARARRVCAVCRWLICDWHSHPGTPRIETSWVCYPECLH